MELINVIGLFLLVSAICCAIGFKRIVYFLSIGYGFSVFGLGVTYLIVSIVNNTFDVILLSQVLLLMIYGFRLSYFLIRRELKNASYKKVLSEATAKEDLKSNVLIKIVIWISVSILYFLQTCPVIIRSLNGNIIDGKNFNSKSIVMPIIGIIISIIGLIIESASDRQKSHQKAERSDMVATKGLYKFCRCPNYVGERIFWLGIFLGGVTSYIRATDWICAILGYVCIFYVMINSAKRLAIKQDKRYKDKEEYANYISTTPLYFPLVPHSIVKKIHNKKNKSL